MIITEKKVSTVKVRNSININQEQPTSHFQSWKIKKDHDMAIYIDKQFNDLQKNYTENLKIEHHEPH